MTLSSKNTTLEEKSKELIVYSLVDPNFVNRNIYALGGPLKNAKYIAQQFGCNLEFRDSEYQDPPIINTNQKYLFINQNGQGTAAVLVGESSKRLTKARDEIHRVYGVKTIKGDVKIKR